MNLDIFKELDAMDGPIDLPSFEPGQSRSTVYTVGETPVVFDVPGTDLKGFVQFTNARLVRIRARRQENRNKVLDLISFAEIVVDETVGLIDPKTGKGTPLKPYTDPRLIHWQDRTNRPHRIHAQNWGSDPEALMDLVNHCRNNFGFAVNKRPPMNTRQNAQYTQTKPYLFEARPRQNLGTNGNDWSTFGAPVTAFEIRVNPDYDNGFKSFVDGATENLTRVIEASKVKNADERAKALEDAARFSGSITGITFTNGQAWARNADITTLVVGDKEFRIWNPGQDSDLTVGDLDAADDDPTVDMGNLDLSDFQLPTAKVVKSGDEPF